MSYKLDFNGNLQVVNDLTVQGELLSKSKISYTEVREITEDDYTIQITKLSENPKPLNIPSDFNNFFEIDLTFLKKIPVVTNKGDFQIFDFYASTESNKTYTAAFYLAKTSSSISGRSFNVPTDDVSHVLGLYSDAITIIDEKYKWKLFAFLISDSTEEMISSFKIDYTSTCYSEFINYENENYHGLDYNLLPIADKMMIPRITETKEKPISSLSNLSDVKTIILQVIYPVGSIYINMINVSPKERFGFGEWERISNRTLYCVGDDDYSCGIGGEEKHTLTPDELPGHTHVTGRNAIKVEWNDNGSYVASASSGSNQQVSNTESTGGNQAHNNMPPYITCFGWIRIA